MQLPFQFIHLIHLYAATKKRYLRYRYKKNIYFDFVFILDAVVR